MKGFTGFLFLGAIGISWSGGEDTRKNQIDKKTLEALPEEGLVGATGDRVSLQSLKLHRKLL